MRPGVGHLSAKSLATPRTPLKSLPPPPANFWTGRGLLLEKRLLRSGFPAALQPFIQFFERWKRRARYGADISSLGVGQRNLLMPGRSICCGRFESRAILARSETRAP